jgi:thiosulfate/3-mercaptopyruvate sulfurtransferase
VTRHRSFSGTPGAGSGDRRNPWEVDVERSNGYAHPDLLAEPEWLWQRCEDVNLRVVDCGDAAAYGRAHIPGAVRLVRDEDAVAAGAPQWLKDPDDRVHLLGPDGVAALAARLGISDDSTVVAYDDYNGSSATRLWWLLTYYGHPNVKVLNGGWQRWLDEDRAATFRETAPAPGRFTPRPKEAMRIRLDELKARHAKLDVQIVNVLWPGMYAGTANPFGNARVGHIPGSVNLPIERFFADEEVPTLKPAPELEAVFAEAGLSPDQETVVHCQAGVRTTMGVFAMSLLGWDRVRAYEASMAEWANRDDTPLTTETG